MSGHDQANPRCERCGGKPRKAVAEIQVGPHDRRVLACSMHMEEALIASAVRGDSFRIIQWFDGRAQRRWEAIGA